MPPSTNNQQLTNISTTIFTEILLATNWPLPYLLKTNTVPIPHFSLFSQVRISSIFKLICWVSR